MTIKNIIFDLGGVIIDIDYHLTSQAFKALGCTTFDEVYCQSKQDSLFDDYDVGKISSSIFRSELRSRLDLSATDREFDNAWNAMLLDLPQDRLDFIKSLRDKYKVFLFSNTNEIHIKEVFNICQRQNGFDNFSCYFDKEYYSHMFGMRKPNKDAFIKLLNDANIIAEETLFVEDSLQHIKGAESAGLNAIHLVNRLTIFDTLSC